MTALFFFGYHKNNMGATLNTFAGLALFVTGITWIAFYPAFYAVATTYQSITSACTAVGMLFGIIGNMSVLRTSARPVRVGALTALVLATLAYIISAVFGILETYSVTRDGKRPAMLGFSFATWIASSVCVLFQVVTSMLVLEQIRSKQESKTDCAYCSTSTPSASRRVSVGSRNRRRVPKSRAHIRRGA